MDLHLTLKREIVYGAETLQNWIDMSFIGISNQIMTMKRQVKCTSEALLDFPAHRGGTGTGILVQQAEREAVTR